MWEVLKTGTLSKITKIDKKKKELSEFIQRNQNYKNIKRNNFIIYIVSKKRPIIQSFKNNVNGTCVYDINEYDIFIKRDNTYKSIAC